MATHPKTAKKKKGTQDIPLHNIPDRAGKRKVYPLEFKMLAAKRVIEGGETADAVARDIGVPTSSMVSKWASMVRNGEPLKPGPGGNRHHPKPAGHDVLKEVRTALERARQARDERLEMAAFIVESDSPDAKEGLALGKRIRAMKRPQ